jgi:glycerophosphoryl diester phosphodiesterase
VIELRRRDRPLLIGHRGAAALAPENSLAAIEAAARHGVDGVEVDVLRAPTGRIVLAHGPEIPPDAPPLADALALAAELDLLVQLDVKLRGVAAESVRLLDHHRLRGRSFVSSFSLPILAEFAAAAPDLPRSFTFPRRRVGVLQRPSVPRRLPGWLQRARAAAVTLNWRVTSPAAVEAAHGAGAAVLVWTVNDAALARTLVAKGADAIITDDPRIVPGGISSQ